MHPRLTKMLSVWAKKEDRGRNFFIVGSSENERAEVVTFVTHRLLCQNACGKCSHCRLFQKKAHPDVIQLERSGSSIKIEQIRELQRMLHHGPFSAPYKIVQINDVESMTPEAVNATLKCLEEPQDRVVFLLLAERQEGIPATLISRCQRLALPDVAPTPTIDPAIEEMISITREPLPKRVEAFEKFADMKGESLRMANMLVSAARTEVGQRGGSRLPLLRAALQTARRLKQNANPALAFTVLALDWK